MLHREGIGGCVFLFLYTINFSILMYGYFTRRIVFKSVFTFLLFHVLLRLAAQSVSIALGSKPQLDVGLLIAFFVLGAEGYFSLVLCAYRFLIHHHQHTYPISGSWLEGKPNRNNKSGKNDPWYQRFKRAMTGVNKDGTKDPWVMTWIHWFMIVANTIIIVGGTQVNASEFGEDSYYKRLTTAKILRCVGQGIFLVINLFLMNFLLLSRRQDLNPTGGLSRGWTKFLRVSPEHGQPDVQAGGPNGDGRRMDGYNGGMHPMLRVLFVAWPPLIIRGIFGLLQGLVNPINYSQVSAYDENGLTTTFVICENILAVLPEWTACCLLCTCMFTRETFDPKKLDISKGTETAAGSPGVDGADQVTLAETKTRGESERKISRSAV